jgi:hypothetical protein
VGVRSIQQHISALTVSDKNVEDPFPSLASLIVVWLLTALLLIITWAYTIADTIRSKFITPSIRTVWVLLVILIPLLGMELYYILGVSQKCNLKKYNTKQQIDSRACFNPNISTGNINR